MSDKKLPVGNSIYINRLNKIRILHLIRNEGKISRAEIVKRTGLSAPTVTRISDDLINKEKLVSIIGKGESSGGRRPKILQFNSKENYVVGIDLGTTFIRGVLSNLDGEFIMEREIPTKIDKGFDKVMEQIGGLIDSLTSRELAKGKDVLGVGLAVAGLVNKNSGIVEYSPVFKWKNVNVRESLKQLTNLPVFYDNVSRLTALGELWYGIGKDCQNFITVNLGYGIGAGIIAKGKPFSGVDGYAGELGHIIVDQNIASEGRSGLSGTLEALSSGYGIAQMASKRLRESNEPGLLAKMVKSNAGEVDAKMVTKAAMAGDPIALEIYDKAVSYLGIGVDTMVKLFNPECIVLSGGLTGAKEFLTDKLKVELEKHAMGKLNREIQILESTFGENAALMGAFSLILNKVLNLKIGNSQD
ncbi:ROK family transcriptional regulator [Flagellimonas algicola]|uniref:ROK family transcriptional regulator n=1 Tax=Flagellimonas algicola TaxID=2583815 RepID=A0ABY2WJD5_9FLAO|nr:ROK family transcriptional regulator [Allomuricauda algicola]TMU54621.1 ROK family transcriptional regulator [Allomuricauda algicola]